MNRHFLLLSQRLHVHLLNLVVVKQLVLGLWVVRLVDAHTHFVVIQGEVPLVLVLLEHARFFSFLLNEALH